MVAILKCLKLTEHFQRIQVTCIFKTFLLIFVVSFYWSCFTVRSWGEIAYMLGNNLTTDVRTIKTPKEICNNNIVNKKM